jgi:hypothetical protein
MIITDLNEEAIRCFVAGREFAVININEDALHQNYRTRFGLKIYPLDQLGVHFDTYTLEIDEENNSGGRTYLFIKDKLPKFKQVEGVSISYPSTDELVSMVSGKRLIYYNKFAEDHCEVENTVNWRMRNDVFNIFDEDEYYLYHEFFRVNIFLQKISETDIEEYKTMTPSDVRSYDITEKMLSKLTEESNAFYDDAITIRYEMESEKLQAQYFLSKFHCNREWDLDPVCLLNYRIVSFILPGTFPAEKARELPKDKIVCDTNTGDKYVIDSIHIDSDICSDLSEFNDWLDRYMYNISLA